jgi:hypothetical protein
MSETHATSRWNTCNVGLKQVKRTLTIYMYSHCNICNIQIKYLQYTFKTTKTFETTLQYMCVAIAIYATPDLLLQYSDKSYTDELVVGRGVDLWCSIYSTCSVDCPVVRGQQIDQLHVPQRTAAGVNLLVITHRVTRQPQGQTKLPTN